MSHSAQRAAAFVSGGVISWAGVVEFGLARAIEAWFVGVAGLVLAVGRIQAALVTGFGTFLGHLVDASFGETAFVLAGAWDGTAAEWLGPLAPFLITAQILAVTGAFWWAVRHR